MGGAPVAAESLEPHFEAVEAARGDITLTYFEFTTLAIMRRLQHEPLDLVILEVGLGGRLDAVNVIDGDCAVITSIDLDHTEFLGNDRESVGREKAGIMRARPSGGRQRPHAAGVAGRACRRTGRRPAPARPRLHVQRRTAPSGNGPGEPSVSPAWPTRRCAA